MWLPTELGKSVCYKLFPLMLEKKLDRDNNLTFIKSPLVSLIVDQVHSLCIAEGLCELLKHIHS